jgi:hypothetical protein
MQTQLPLPEKTHRRFKILAIVVLLQLYLLSLILPATRPIAVQLLPLVIGQTTGWSLTLFLKRYFPIKNTLFAFTCVCFMGALIAIQQKNQFIFLFYMGLCSPIASLYSSYTKTRNQKTESNQEEKRGQGL